MVSLLTYPGVLQVRLEGNGVLVEGPVWLLYQGEVVGEKINVDTASPSLLVVRNRPRPENHLIVWPGPDTSGSCSTQRLHHSLFRGGRADLTALGRTERALITAPTRPSQAAGISSARRRLLLLLRQPSASASPQAQLTQLSAQTSRSPSSSSSRHQVVRHLGWFSIQWNYLLIWGKITEICLQEETL